jgi:hypothetical protein
VSKLADLERRVAALEGMLNGTRVLHVGAMIDLRSSNEWTRLRVIELTNRYVVATDGKSTFEASVAEGTIDGARGALWRWPT